MRVTRFSGKRPVLLVIGGSQGAEALNKAVWENFEGLITLCDIIHITGLNKMNTKIKIYMSFFTKRAIFLYTTVKQF